MHIKNLSRELNWHPQRIWRKRELSQIRKIIIHQEMGNSSIEKVNEYQITPGPNNHITEKGCPHFCYHFGIRENGEIVQTNELSDITWHCTGQNTSSIGIMLQGNFKGPGHEVGTIEPDKKQIAATQKLVDFLLNTLKLSNHDVFGHYHFGKPACPGYTMQKWIETKREQTPDTETKKLEKTVINIQSCLNKLGYTTGKVDGIIGVKTLAAIRRFQSDHKLEVDGIVGSQTWNTLLKLTQA